MVNEKKEKKPRKNPHLNRRPDKSGLPLFGGKSIKPGEKRSLKLKTPEERQEAYLDFCHHMSLGKMKNSWRYRKGDIDCNYVTMGRYMKDEEEFDPVLFQNALCDGLFFWEGELEKAALGKNPDVNIAALQMAMRHKFGWDKSDAHASDETKEAMAHFASVTRFLEKKGRQLAVLDITPEESHTSTEALSSPQEGASQDQQSYERVDP